ncbi:MAG: hypothetical protein RMH97_05775 [Verrucomicrobiales bacterium]|nr:hypothetical protein [Verrucomicrobiales bacterium]
MNDTDRAVREAVRRQARTVELRQKIEEAQRAEQRNDLATAAKLYEACYELIGSIGAGVEAETKTVVSRLVAVRVELAKQASKRRDYPEADAQLRAALRVDPKNETVLALKRENDRLLAETEALRPNREVVDAMPVVQSNRLAAARLVQDGRLLWEMGQLDEAEAKLREAIKLDPANTTASYYLNLVQESRFTRAARAHDSDARKYMVEVEQAWERPAKHLQLPVPNPYARTNLVHTGQGRQKIISKLNRIRLGQPPNEIKYDGLELAEVLRDLAAEIKRRDPEGEGINFLIMREHAAPVVVDTTAVGGYAGEGGAPAAQQMVAAAPAEEIDLTTVRIRIFPPLSNVRAADVLDAITKTADQPIKYSIEDYAVVFSAKRPEPEPLYIRTYRVDPNTFVQGLESVGYLPLGIGMGGMGMGGFGGMGMGGFGGMGMGGMGMGGFGGMGMGGMGGAVGAYVARVDVVGGQAGGMGGGFGTGTGAGGQQGAGISYITVRGTNAVADLQAAVRNFFAANGVDFTSATGTNKSVFFNDRLGLLVVRATLQDLDIIEAAIQVLNASPPQVNIKAKFIEIEQSDLKALGFDWYLGNFLMNQGKIGMQGGTAPSFYGEPTTANPEGVFPGSALGGTALTPTASDQLVTGGLNASGWPALFTMTGILTDPQFRVVMRALEQRTGVEVLSAPEVTVLSGRQAQMKATDVQNIIMYYGFAQQVGGMGGVGGGGTFGGGMGTTGGF